MRQLIKIFSWIALLALGLQSARAYSFLGPVANGGDAWQTGDIGYNPNLFIDPLATGPKNIGEEYRRNIPVLYYAYDPNFLGYFGSNGPASIDSAFAILNNSFTYTNSMATNSAGVDGYTSLISEFPLETRQNNYEASALGLFDLKSFTLGLMMEQLGLADPERYTWTLHNRFQVTPGAPCPANMEYLVVQRNLDFVTSPLNQLQYSPYVNDTLYTYFIDEFCTTLASGEAPLVATTVPLAEDPTADTYSPVADFIAGNISYGDFYNGLTRDDAAGLRYLYSTNNDNFESAPAGSLLMTTNIGTAAQEQLLTTADLSALLAAATTNTPAALQTLFPNVVVASSSFTFSAVYTPNVIAYYTNAIGSPYGSAQVSVIVTNGTIGHAQTNFFDIFANVITNGNLANNPNIVGGAGVTLNYSPNTAATLVTTTIGQPAYGTAYPPPVVTNTTVQSFTQAGVPSGEYFVIPTNQCGWKIVPTVGFPIANQPVYTTNIIASATNSATTSSNGVVTTNATTGFVTTQSIVTAFTSHTYVVEPINCSSAAAPAGLYQGDGKIQFIRLDYDSLIGQFVHPITNYFTKVLVTNSQPVTQYFQRVVTAPDFIFSASDMATVTGNGFSVDADARNVNFDQGNILPGLAGPGVITSPTTITFDKAEPVYFNNSTTPEMDGSPYFTGFNLADEYYDFYFVWAQFDGTTNEPVVFPNGTSIANLENQVLVQISVTPTNGINFTAAPPILAIGTNGVPYTALTFAATDGSKPLTWSAAGLPSGLVMTSANSVGTLSGTPTQSGTFDITVQLTDSINRSVQWNYSITIY